MTSGLEVIMQNAITDLDSKALGIEMTVTATPDPEATIGDLFKLMGEAVEVHYAVVRYLQPGSLFKVDKELCKNGKVNFLVSPDSEVHLVKAIEEEGFKPVRLEPEDVFPEPKLLRPVVFGIKASDVQKRIDELSAIDRQREMEGEW